MKLKIMTPVFSVLKLPPVQPVPVWAMNCELFSITRTEEELSIVCPSSCLPEGETFQDLAPDWRCIRVEGPLDFSLTGILSSLAGPLAEQGISIFAVSTFNTDYIMVKRDSLAKARAVLERAGHTFTGHIPA